jgi:para-nitrobenzyl esterase
MRWIMVAAAVCLWSCALVGRAEIAEPVRVDGGLISGVDGKEAGVRVFKGVPYAAAPVGELRWREPGAVVGWAGVRKADQFGAICPQAAYVPGSFYQLEFFQNPQPAMSEDCLYLNVWTAAKDAGEKRPVMVWIHGGGGVQGYGSEPCFDGEALARHGVVLVTFNYRLGIFGHFAHPEIVGGERASCVGELCGAGSDCVVGVGAAEYCGVWG